MNWPLRLVDIIAELKKMKHELILASFRKFLRKKREHLETTYNKWVEPIEEVLNELSNDNIFFFNDVTLFNDWTTGAKSAMEVYDVLAAMDFDDVAKNKLLKKLKDFKEEFDRSSKELMVHVDSAISNLEKDAVPDMKQYLELCKKYFGRLALIDSEQSKVIYGVGQNDDNIKEMTLNQALHYMKANFTDENHWLRVIYANIIISFEKVDTKTGETLEEHWFLAPPKYKDVIVKEMNIKLHINKPIDVLEDENANSK